MQDPRSATQDARADRWSLRADIARGGCVVQVRGTTDFRAAWISVRPEFLRAWISAREGAAAPGGLLPA